VPLESEAAKTVYRDCLFSQFPEGEGFTVSKGVLEKAHRLHPAVPAGCQTVSCGIHMPVHHASLHIQEFVQTNQIPCLSILQALIRSIQERLL
jgi:hypothetical protein